MSFPIHYPIQHLLPRRILSFYQKKSHPSPPQMSPLARLALPPLVSEQTPPFQDLLKRANNVLWNDGNRMSLLPPPGCLEPWNTTPVEDSGINSPPTKKC